MGLPGYTRNIWTWSRYREKDGESGRQSFTTENYDNYELRLRRKAEKKKPKLWQCRCQLPGSQDCRAAHHTAIQDPFTYSSHFHHILYTFITLIHHTVTSGYSGNWHRLWELWPYLVNIIVQYFRVTGCPKSQGYEATKQMCCTALYFYCIPITRTEDEGLGGHSPWTTSMGQTAIPSWSYISDSLLPLMPLMPDMDQHDRSCSLLYLHLFDSFEMTESP